VLVQTCQWALEAGIVGGLVNSSGNDSKVFKQHSDERLNGWVADVRGMLWWSGGVDTYIVRPCASADTFNPSFTTIVKFVLLGKQVVIQFMSGIGPC
jgi:hypothetical protein